MHKRYSLRVLLLLLVVGCCWGGGNLLRGDTISGPILNPANGHYYYLLSETTWSDAEAQSIALGGHLASVNDQAEQDWIFDVFPLPQQAFVWLGGRDQDIPQWIWTDGTPFTYTNWGGGGGITEPDGNPAVGESYVAMFTPGQARAGTWADLYNDNPDAFGLAEVDSLPATPLPAPLWLGASMFGALGLARFFGTALRAMSRIRYFGGLRMQSQ